MNNASKRTKMKSILEQFDELSVAQRQFFDNFHTLNTVHQEIIEDRLRLKTFWNGFTSVISLGIIKIDHAAIYREMSEEITKLKQSTAEQNGFHNNVEPK